ncbi:zinc finger protein 862-like [Mytilus edulis]|uniref:zinc finger protein 862-like n=1 Tax=Mytilus edulis TaxID=6550 RepID=UPI0039EE02B3
MPPKKQRIVVLPGQKTLLSFVGRDKNNNSENAEELSQTSNTNTDITEESIAVDEDPNEVEHDNKHDDPGEEILDAIDLEIESEIDEKISKSPYVTILADESTDISNNKKITINARIINPETSIPETVFLRNKSYSDGTGEGLTSVITEEMAKHNITNDKLIGFGSDGATVMSGSDKGVKGRLMELNPHMIHIHCMAHRLDFCTSQAAEGGQLMKHYQEWLTSVFYYFKASPTREGELHEVQSVLNLPILKCKEIHAVRWLSCFEAVQAVYRSLDALISYFHKKAKDPKAKGLLKKMATTSFIYITYMLMDVLPIVSKLCLTLQKQDLDVAVAKVCLDRCKNDLLQYKENTQIFPTHLENFDTDIQLIDGHQEFKGHILFKSNTNFNALKSSFVNKLLDNLTKRFPQQSLMNNFFVLAMRSINMEDDIDKFGVTEVGELLDHFGKEKVHKGKVSAPIFDRDIVLKEWREAKLIVKSLKYPVDRMKHMWQLLTVHHTEDLPNIIKLAQIYLIIPLHTADCERTFSIQNQILTPKRNRLNHEQCDKLIRIKIYAWQGFGTP